MDNDPPVEQLIAKYIDELASASELSELAQLIVDQSSAADAFAEATRFDGLLTEIVGNNRDARETRRLFAHANAIVLRAIGSAENPVPP